MTQPERPVDPPSKLDIDTAVETARAARSRHDAACKQIIASLNEIEQQLPSLLCNDRRKAAMRVYLGALARAVMTSRL